MGLRVRGSQGGGRGGRGTAAAADHLTAAWRTQIPDRLDAMVRAWDDPDAWQGRTSAGGVEQTAEETGYVALDEPVAHSWDLARATGQEPAIDATSVGGALRFAEAVVASAPAGVPGLFGPALAVPDGASDPDRLLRLNPDPPLSACCAPPARHAGCVADARQTPGMPTRRRLASAPVW